MSERMKASDTPLKLSATLMPAPALALAVGKTYVCAVCGPLPKTTRVLRPGGKPIETPTACEHLLSEQTQQASQAERLGRVKRDQDTFADVVPPRDWAIKPLPWLPKLAELTDQDAMASARRYIDQFPMHRESGRGRLWRGTPGTAKSYWSKWVAREVEKQGYFVIWTKIKVLAGLLSNWDTKAELIKAMIACDLLVLDELVSQGETRWTTDDLFGVIDARHDMGRPTIITTNFDDLAIARHYKGVLTRGEGGMVPNDATTIIQRFLSRLQPPAFKRVQWQGQDLRSVLAVQDDED